jgi:hypothetical protein
MSRCRLAPSISRWVLLGALTLAGAAFAQAPTPDPRTKLLTAITQTGEARQVFSECSIPDVELPGLAAAYNSLLRLTTALASTTTTLNISRTDIDSAFHNGMVEAAAKGAPSAAACAQIRARLPALNQVEMGVSQMIDGVLTLLSRSPHG